MFHFKYACFHIDYNKEKLNLAKKSTVYSIYTIKSTVNKTIIRKYLPFLQKLSFSPIYCYPFLIVLYFVLHENNANFGLIPLPVSAWFAFYYLLVTGIIFLVASYFFNKATKSLLFTALIIVILLFDG